jgi:2-keto-4-pentenoate hydratase
MDRTEQFARHLIDAHQGQHRFLASADNGPVDAAQAYAVQTQVWQSLIGKTRPHVWKLGAASNTSEPVAAPIFPTRYSVSPGEFRRRGLCSIGVEAEIAVRFAHPLAARPTPYSREEILDALGSLHVAMEIVDRRLHDAEYAGPLWCLADNLVNGALIIGAEIPRWREQTWPGRRVSIVADGALLDERQANPPLDDMFHCLPWWIDHVGGARAGDVVTTGAWTGMHPIGEARELRVAFEGLGECLASLVAAEYR